MQFNFPYTYMQLQDIFSKSDINVQINQIVSYSRNCILNIFFMIYVTILSFMIFFVSYFLHFANCFMKIF